MASDSESSSTEDIHPGEEDHASMRGQEVALLPGNEAVPFCSESQLTAQSNRNQVAPLESVITGGTFSKAVIGPQTNKMSSKVKNYNHPKIIENHYHYEKEPRQKKRGRHLRSVEEDSTSSSDSGSLDHFPKRGRIRQRRRRDSLLGEEHSVSGTQYQHDRRRDVQGRAQLEVDEAYSKIADGIYMDGRQPLRKGTKVYKGYQLHASGYRRPLAIKMITPCDATNLREVKNLLELEPHPNVVHLVHSNEQHQPCLILYIAMELCSSENLNDFLNKNRTKKASFNFKKTMSFARQIVDGIRHIHRNKIIHRDLKPENLLLSLGGEQIKVSDFGISKQLQPNSAVTRQTQPGLGTDGFRSPEAYGHEPISLKSDIFSLGLTLYSLFSYGEHAFGSNIHLQNNNIITNQGCDLSQLLIEGAKKDELLDLIQQTLDPDPSKRPNIEEVASHIFFDIVPPQDCERGSSSLSGLQTAGLESSSDQKEGTHEPDLDSIVSSDEEDEEFREELATQAEEECRQLLDENRFEKAMSILNNLRESKRQKMLLAESYLMLGNERKAKECMKILLWRTVCLSSSDQPEDVLGAVEICIAQLKLVRAIILLQYATILYSQSSDGQTSDGKVQMCGIWRCAFTCTKLIKLLFDKETRFRKFVSSFAVAGIHEMFRRVKRDRGNTYAYVERETRLDEFGIPRLIPKRCNTAVEWEAACLNEIGTSYHVMERSKSAIKFYEQGLDALREASRQGFSQRIYGILLHNIGIAKADLGFYEVSSVYFSRAMQSLENAIDFPSINDKELFLARIRVIHRQARQNSDKKVGLHS